MTDQNTSDTPVSVIGLGLMGQALAGAFLRAGHPTTVWNRTAAKAERLVADGATLAGSVADAVAAGRLVVVCVTGYDAVHELLDPATFDGRVVVNLTSGTSAQARETAKWAGDAYLDGAIMTVPEGIGTPEAVILYSGPRSAFVRHEQVLAVLATSTYLGADHGLASLHDVAMLAMMWSIINGFLQGAALVGSAGVDASAFVSIVGPLIGTVTGWLPAYAQAIDDGAYPVFDATLDTQLAAMAHLVHESESVGVNAELPRLVEALAARAVAAGRGGDGYAAMIEQFRRPAGE